MTFATPLFLIAMTAGLIPVILHMINRQKAKTLPFSTLRFLRLSNQRTRRRKYLHEYLLLLLRVAGLMLIAIGLAQPTINRFGNPLGKNTAATDVVLILDNSASMSKVDAGGSRWEAASRVCEQLVDQLGDGDSLALLLTCGPPRPEIERLQRNHEAVRQVLDECRPQSQRADLAMRIQAAEKLLGDSPAPNKEILVVTDMQKVSWQSLRPDASKAAENLPPVILLDLQGDPVPNVAVKSVVLNSSGPIASMPMQLTVELVGDSALAQQRYIELVVDGKVHVTSPSITIEPGGTAEHTFQFSIDRSGVHHCEARLVGDDACALDDNRFFAVTVAPHVAVAVIKPQKHAIAYLEASYYLERALAPVTGSDWAIRMTPLTKDGLASASLSDYAVVFCVNLPALDVPEARRLRDYVRRGGHLAWICGDHVAAASYSAMNQSAQGDLLPVEMLGRRGPTAEQPDGWHVGSIDNAHPALAPLAEPASLYQSVEVYHYFETAPLDEDHVRVLARLDNGAPLLLEREVESGSVLLLTTSVDVAWSNLPLRPIFLPLIAGTTFHLAQATAGQPQLIAGTPIVAKLDSGRGAELLRPGGATIRFAPNSDFEPTVRYTDTHHVGIYEFHARGASNRAVVAFALNLDPGETSIESTPFESVQERFGEQRIVLLCADPADLAATISELREGESLLELFLLGVLIALLAEAFVANRRAQKKPVATPRRAGHSRARQWIPDRLEDSPAVRH